MRKLYIEELIGSQNATTRIAILMLPRMGIMDQFFELYHQVTGVKVLLKVDDLKVVKEILLLVSGSFS